MDSKQTVQQFLDNLFFDNEKAFEVVADDIRVNWPGFGMEDIVGKENLRNFFVESGPEKVLQQTIENLIEERDTVIADGKIVTIHKGKQETSYFADVYKLNNGKITSLISYMVLDKSNPENL